MGGAGGRKWNGGGRWYDHILIKRRKMEEPVWEGWGEGAFWMRQDCGIHELTAVVGAPCTRSSHSAFHHGGRGGGLMNSPPQLESYCQWMAFQGGRVNFI